MKKALIGGRGFRIVAYVSVGLGLPLLAGCESPVSVDRTSELRVVLRQEPSRFPGLVVQVEGGERSHRFGIEDFAQDTSVSYTWLTTEAVPVRRPDSTSVSVRLAGPDGPVEWATKFDPTGSEEWTLSLRFTVSEDPTFECRTCVDAHRFSVPAALQDPAIPGYEEALWLVWSRGHL